MTIEQICQGDSRNIAYDNLLRLLEQSDVQKGAATLLQRINLNRPADDHLSCASLSGRSKVALDYFARKKTLLAAMELELKINQEREKNNLPEVHAPWFESSTSLTDLRAGFKEKLGSDPALLKRIQESTPP